LERFIFLWHLFAVLDYKRCYRALLYIGYDKKLDQCFVSTPDKKKYSNLLKLKERSTYNLLFVDQGHSHHLLAPLFSGAIEENNVIRNVTVFSGEKVSKVVNLFVVKERHLRPFMAEQ
jgi:hypothetical protein